MGQIRVKAVLTAIHAIEGPPIFLRTSYGGLGEAQEEGYERSELLINKALVQLNGNGFPF